jgi:Zn-finger nucleic acid-binding protein
MNALTGLSTSEFEILLTSFEQVLYEHFASKERKRKVGGGRIGALIGARDRLFYILFYAKVYPTYDLASFIFGVDRSRCFHWTKDFMQLVEKALGRNIVMPKRKVTSIEELLEVCPEARDLFIDGVERRTQRPSKSKARTKRYSGKKKMHSRKNTIISNENRKIVFVSPTKEGRIHDLKQLYKTGVLDHIPKEITLWLDKGYLGIKSLLKNDNSIMMPHKKPRGRELTPAQKQENTIISGIRITVEHAINGIKRFGAMSGTYRNRKGQDDHMIYLCAALWNFHLQYQNC